VFFSFDGIDGVGKSTQIEYFCEWLRENAHDVVVCRDPGSTALGERIREILLTPTDEFSISMLGEMLLYMAARAQLVEELIRPALRTGKTVVSDRYLLANVVYQGHAGGLDVNSIWQVGAIATGRLMPDCVFLLDVPPEQAARRLGVELDRLERRGPKFRLALRKGFLTEAARDPTRVHVIDASGTIENVRAEIVRIASAVMAR
jgi:dTMP kinase